MELTWDETKREKVLVEHQIDFAKIRDVFDDPCGVYIEDFKHSTKDEIRFKVIKLKIGWSKNMKKIEKDYEYLETLSKLETRGLKRITRPKFLDNIKSKSLRDSKSRITIMIDADIIENFKKLSEESGKGCQTLINQTLHNSIGLEKTILSEVKDDLLKDRRFLEELKTALAI